MTETGFNSASAEDRGSEDGDARVLTLLIVPDVAYAPDG